jgi:hypothetical protein
MSCVKRCSVRKLFKAIKSNDDITLSELQNAFKNAAADTNHDDSDTDKTYGSKIRGSGPSRCKRKYSWDGATKQCIKDCKKGWQRNRLTKKCQLKN